MVKSCLSLAQRDSILLQLETWLMLNQVSKKNSEHFSVEQMQAVNIYKWVFKADTKEVCSSTFFN